MGLPVSEVNSLEARDHQHVWHPCSQMKDYESFKPLAVVGASGSHIELADGRKIIDANSSWWCKSLGHQHPRLKAALQQQMNRFEHVIFANTTNAVIVELSEKLAQLSPSLNKVFYASEGSSAVEIAMKMSVHARNLLGDKNRNVFLSLANGYHGETLGALSVSDVGLYREPYASMLLDAQFIVPPYVNSVNDPIWQDCSAAWVEVEKYLEQFSETATAVIVEPVLQGAGGMKVYSQDFLARLHAWTRRHNVHFIADEIMTGIGRTGKMLACEHAGIEPDFICLSKGLTSGWLPFSVVLTRQSIYDIFYDDYASGKSFLHSHTFSGNVLAASVALEVLNIMHEERICDQAQALGAKMRVQMQAIADATGLLRDVRGIGAVVAADLVQAAPGQRLGFEVYQRAVQLGALLRPLGNTIYWLPPLTMDEETLSRLANITNAAITPP